MIENQSIETGLFIFIFLNLTLMLTLIFTHSSCSSSSSPTPTSSPFALFQATPTGGSSLVLSPFAQSTFLMQSQSISALWQAQRLHIVLGLDKIDPVLEAEEMALNKEWMKLYRSSHDYLDGVDAFLNFAFRDVREEDKNRLTIRCPCDKCRNALLKTRLEARFDLLRCGIYEKYTTWEFHDESIDQFNGDNSSENNENEEVNMLQDACGVAGMGLGIENEKDIEEHIHE
ncbi:hypothetical protein Cgig2_000860 [Carnegiea gigantea]|uniref:Transposase-associated domain-containing protein n=1 Tax=Carnegiea gigantea TaxID=171969 RepID=A0A9Q1K0B7_9CARY|nr:hypothetical protein Cgig2_000860 [Carnegiea gigantea]